MKENQNLNSNLDDLIKKFKIKIDKKEPILRRRNDSGGHFIGTLNGIKCFFKWGKKDKIEKELKIIKNIQDSLEKDDIIQVPQIHDYIIKANVAIIIMEYCNMNHTSNLARYKETIIKGLQTIKELNFNCSLSPLNYNIRFLIKELKMNPINNDSINLKSFHITDIESIEKYSEKAVNDVLSIEDSNCFVHGDFVPHNFVVTNNSQLILFDFEKSGIGHPEEDLARLINFYMLHNRKLCKSLIEITNDKTGLFSLRFYKALFLMHFYYKKYQNKPIDLYKFQYFFWNHTITNLINGRNLLTQAFISEYLSIERKLLDSRSLKAQKTYIR